MFAFAIVERDSGRVLLGRDRLGIKPLYLTEDSHRIRFASTLPALLAGGGVDTRIDPVALHHYMTFHSVVPAPLTILRGVRKIPPGVAASPSSPTAAAPPRPTGRRTSPGTTTAPTGPNATGKTPCCRRCEPRSSADSSPTSRSAACCPAAWTPA